MCNSKLSGGRVHTFSKVVSSKVNVNDRQEFDLIYFQVEVQHFILYAMRIYSFKTFIINWPVIYILLTKS